MLNEVHWYQRLPAVPQDPLQAQIDADVVVVGGGMAGLAAAQWLAESSDLGVVVLESTFCGGGATGRSSGFITPDSELQVADLIRLFGAEEAKRLWETALHAGDRIRSNVQRFAIACDFMESDCLYLGAGRDGAAAVQSEHRARESLGLPSRLYGERQLAGVLDSSGYAGGLRYGGTFAIDAHAYVQGLKRALIAQGVRIFEGTPATAIADGRVDTAQGRVNAAQVVVCLDRFAPDLGVGLDTFHAQTSIIVSEPLEPSVRESIFPDGPLLAWDTDLIYQYFRLTGDGRLQVGGGALHETYAMPNRGSRTPERLEHFIRERLPALRGCRFERFWQGLIGVTRDMMALAGPSPRRPGQFQALCAAGLPWSVLAGEAAARAALADPREPLIPFDPTRHVPLAGPLSLLPRPLSFALSHLYQKHRPARHSA